MKPSTHRLLNRVAGFGLLLALAPFAGAQNPAAASAPPAKASAPAGEAKSQGAPAPAPAPVPNDQVSYMFGVNFGEQMRGIGATNEIVPDAVMRGIKDGLQGKKLTPADRQQVQEFAHSMMMASQTRNQKAAQEFLAHNGGEKGVKTTASGLQYKVIVPGDAKAPAIAPSDQVTVNYRGTLIDGTEFDSSYSRGTPATFQVNGVIKGWQEALVLMKPGAKWDLFVPPELAYGPSPRPGIPANSLLIFEVEVLSAKAKEAPQGAAPSSGAPASKPQPAASKPPQP